MPDGHPHLRRRPGRLHTAAVLGATILMLAAGLGTAGPAGAAAAYADDWAAVAQGGCVKAVWFSLGTAQAPPGPAS
ncbi:hypothetical protein [Streptomyces sp. DSM 40907]|uniref:hypothetical protein n=1 Tax=Streptomyces kutzneri TaxID=3051179 RepID=UPI0028D83CC5|nr:hypothetical protein [Streptomyces sp. DSM 40907]